MLSLFYHQLIPTLPFLTFSLLHYCVPAAFLSIWTASDLSVFNCVLKYCLMFLYKKSQTHTLYYCCCSFLSLDMTYALGWALKASYPSIHLFQPTPGLTSRPDRILTSNNLRVVQMSLHGDGTAYKSKHSVDIMLHRLHRVLRAARDSFSGYAGYPCLQDCGPRGSCRCGVCVERTDMGSCQLPSCEECSPHTFVLLLAFSSILSLLFILAGIATVNILIVASHVDQSNAFFFLGCTCCLCNPRLVRQSTATARHCAGRFLRCLGVGKLPPVYLLLLSLTVVVLSLPVTFVVFKPTFDTVSGAMPEEYFPSDHMMLHAQLEIL